MVKNKKDLFHLDPISFDKWSNAVDAKISNLDARQLEICYRMCAYDMSFEEASILVNKVYHEHEFNESFNKLLVD